MENIKKYDFKTLIKKLVGKKVHFTSDCEFFPNFNVVGKVLKSYINNAELVFKFKNSDNNKIIDIGSNMKNLKFEVLN